MKPNSEIDNQTLINLARLLEPSPRQRALQRARFLSWRISRKAGWLVKRALDVVASIAALVLASPLLMVVALLIKVTDGGPVLFWQTRVGMWGKPFRFPKFRSMVTNAEALRAQLMTANAHGKGITFKIKHDPRITWIGRFIRKTSIDELPQLWCVLKGEMSLVGPRPALVSEVQRYTLDDRRRLDTTPGLTCSWQVSGRSDIPFHEQCRLDVEYIEQQTVFADIKLLLKTIPAVITGRGAY
jgi:lipopolysaccharide/colanic/teichoic acid biosynthesis glycosyltransferase